MLCVAWVIWPVMFIILISYFTHAFCYVRAPNHSYFADCYIYVIFLYMSNGIAKRKTDQFIYFNHTPATFLPFLANRILLSSFYFTSAYWNDHWTSFFCFFFFFFKTLWQCGNQIWLNEKKKKLCCQRV